MTLNQNELEPMERRFAMYVLVAIRENPMSTKTDIMRLNPGFEKTKFERINEMIVAGYVETVKEQNYSTRRLRLTKKGDAAVDAILNLRSIMNGDGKE